MTVTAAALLVRKRDLTPAQFKDHYENHHVPLLYRLFPKGEYWLTYQRHYVMRSEDGKAVAFHGDQSRYRITAPMDVLNSADRCSASFDFDCYTEMTFADEGALQRWYEAYNKEGVHDVIVADEKRFTEPDEMRAVRFEVCGE